MKAIVCHGYGTPDILMYEDIEKPTPGSLGVPHCSGGESRRPGQILPIIADI